MASRVFARAAIAAVAAAIAVPGAADAAFSIVASPNAFSGNNLLTGVSASSATDAWAVGSLCCSIRNSGTGALLEHWDGQSWKVVLGPDARFLDEDLEAVADITPSWAWAVGRVKQSGYGGGNPLILHWDGASWKTLAPPTGVTGELRGVSGDGAGGAWAVGDDGHGHPLVLRCSKAMTCARVTVPQLGAVSHLRGIKTFGPDDAWAVGDGGNVTYVVHWNGAAWSLVWSPNPDPNVNVLQAVTGVASNDLWAVGRKGQSKFDTGGSPGWRTLALHWNGSSWSTVSTPNLGDQDTLMGVAASASNAVTAVGTYQNVTTSADRTLGLHWNGSSWSTLSMPNSGTTDNLLRGAARIPGTSEVWAVGSRYATSGGPVQTLVLRGS